MNYACDPKDWEGRDEPAEDRDELIPCQVCQEGHVMLGEHFVSHEMAIDAGYPEMEGASAGIEWGRCDCCYGVWQECETCSYAGENNVTKRF